MEPDSSLDFVVDDLPGIGCSYQMTGPTVAAAPSLSITRRRVVYGLTMRASLAATTRSTQVSRPSAGLSSTRWYRSGSSGSTP